MPLVGAPVREGEKLSGLRTLKRRSSIPRYTGSSKLSLGSSIDMAASKARPHGVRECFSLSIKPRSCSMRQWVFMRISSLVFKSYDDY